MRILAGLSALILAATLAVAFAGGAAANPKPAPAAPDIPAQGGRVIASDARLAGDDQRTRLIIDMNRKTDLAAFTLADPYRVVVDLPDVVFDLPSAAGRKGRGLISAYRYGLFAPGKARIVIDASGPVAIDKAYVLDRVDDQPARLVIDLVRTDRAAFIRSAAKPRTPSAPMHTASLPRDAGDDGGLPVIVVDPGHGGIDSGAIAPSGEEEKAVVLAVSKILADRLERTGRFRVIMTRRDDTFLPLGERVEVARKSGASLFISIHADSISRREGDARGATIYTVSEKASDREAQRLADKENKADLIAGIDLTGQSDDVANILFDLAHRETKNHSGMFARTLVGRMRQATPMHKSPLRSAGFSVLRAPDIPSVLIELGFLSNRDDVRLLTSDAWRMKVADAMVDAVDRFFANHVAFAR